MKTQKATIICNHLQPFYFSHRKSALMLAYACTLDEASAYAAAHAAFVTIGKRAEKHGIPNGSEIALYSHIYNSTRKSMVSEGHTHPSPAGFHTLSKEARCVLALRAASGMDRESIKQILHLDDSALQVIDLKIEAMDSDAAGWLREHTGRMHNKNEIWDSICFSLEKHYRLNRYVKQSLLAFIAVLCLVFLLFEGGTALQFFDIQRQVEQDVLADRYLDESYYLRKPTRFSSEQPNITINLSQRLIALDDQDQIRAAFRFYDPQIMSRVKIDNQSLMDLYVGMYHAGYNRGRLHTLIARGVGQYFSNYEIPFLPKDRKENFVSPYESIYQSTLEYAETSSFHTLHSMYPDILGSQEEFETYLFSDLCLRELYPLRSLLFLNRQLLSADSFSNEDIEAYEKAIFAFQNPAGLNGSYTPAPFSYFQQETDAFFARRLEISRLLHQALQDECVKILPNNNLTNDVLDGTDCSLFSATLSKKETLALAEGDSRFTFLGVAAPYSSGYPEHLEHALAAEAFSNPLKTFEVFQVDNRVEQYSLNYAAPLDVPQGFIDQLRDTVSCEDTLFEQLLGYHFDMRYAHPRKMPGYLILRSLFQQPSADNGFCFQVFKNYPKMAAN